MNDTDLIQLVVVALVSGGLGSFLTAMMRHRHERSQALRERKIAAADDFYAAAHVVLEFVLYSEQHGPAAENFRDEVGRQTLGLFTHVSRLTILFGPSSGTVKLARKTGDHLDAVAKGIADDGKSGPANENEDGADDPLNAAVADLAATVGQFGEVAHRETVGGYRTRVVASVLRGIKRSAALLGRTLRRWITRP